MSKKLFTTKRGRSYLTEDATVIKTISFDELVKENIDKFMGEDDTEGLDEIEQEDGGDEDDFTPDFGDDAEGEGGEFEEGEAVEQHEDGSITITLSKDATVADLIAALKDLMDTSPAADIALSEEEMKQAEDEVAAEFEDSGDEDGGEEDAPEETEDEDDVPDLGGQFVEEDEETIDQDGSQGNVKANGSVGAPVRKTHDKSYTNGKTVSTSLKTQSGEGTPASSVGAPVRKTHDKSYKNGKTVSSNLNPGRPVVGG